MRNQKKGKSPERQEITGLEKLGLRVSAMINSPKAQLERRARIHRLDTDADADWVAVLGLLGETDGLSLEHTDEGDVIVKWEAPTDDDRGAGVEETELLEEVAPF